MAKQVSPETVKLAGQLLKQEHERAEKLASDLKEVAVARDREKRASRIAFREVELGASEPFRSNEEYEKKVASLLADPELEVIEKALERGYTGLRKVGELVGSTARAPGAGTLEDYIRSEVFNN
jgi:hypothetical protein